MISGKAAGYKLFWIGNEKGLGRVGIFLAKKWVGKIIDVNRVSDRVIVSVLVQITIILVISVYAPQ